MLRYIQIAIFSFFIIGTLALMPSQNGMEAHYDNDKVEFDDPTEYDRLYKMRELEMLADPATGKIPAMVRSREMLYYRTYLEPRQTRGDNDLWQSAGPYLIGGRTRALAIDRTNENIFIAAGVSGGIYRTVDAGKTWTLVSDTLSHQGIVSLCQDARVGFEHIWYAVGGEASGNSASGGSAYYLGDGAFKSIDSGKTWQPIASTAIGTPNSFSNEFQVCWRIASHPRTDSSTVLLATYGGIWRSTDEGKTFKPVLGGTSNQSYYTDIAISKSGVCYATLSSDGIVRGFHRSTDAGLTWSNITPNGIITNYERTVLDINPNNENEVYFFSHLADSTNAGGVRSQNFNGDSEWIALLKYTYLGGNGAGTNAKWEDLSKNLPAAHNTFSGSFDMLNVQGGYDMFVRVQPGTGHIFIAGTNMYRSKSGFTTATATQQIGGYAPKTSLPNFGVYPNHHPDCHDLLFFSSDANKVLSASDGGVHLCTDVNASEVKWISCNNGYLTTQPYTVALDPTPYSTWLHSGFQDNGNYITSDFRNPKSVWRMPYNGDGAYAFIAPNKAFFIMSTQEGKVGIFKIDGNINRLTRRRIDPVGPTNDDYVFINPFTVAPNNQTLYIPAGKYVYRYDNVNDIAINNVWEKLATGWFRLPDSINTPNLSSSRPAQITAIAASAKTLYLGTNNRDVFRVDDAHTNTPVLTKISKSPLPANGYVSCLYVDPSNDSNLIVVYSNYGVNSIFYTQNAGSTWLLIGGNLEKNNNSSGVAPSVRWVDAVKMPDGSRRYYAATSVGLFSTDLLRPGTLPSKDSTVWQQEATGKIGATVCNFIHHRDVDHTVAVSTHGKGTFIIQHKKASGGNTNFSASLYPNPANNFVNVKLDNWDNNSAAVVISNLNGQVVARSQFSNLNGVNDYLSLSTGNLAKGIYIIDVSANKKHFTQKFVISQ